MSADDTPGDSPWDTGFRFCPEIALPKPAFAAALERHGHGDGRALHSQRIVDLYLATAADGGDEEAWSILRERFGPVLRGRLRARRATADETEAILDDLLGHLGEPPPGGGAATRIGTFSGRGPLAAWLTVIAVRRLWARFRERADGAADPRLATCADAAATPLGRAIGAEHARRLEDALHDAWAGLTPRECLAVLLHYRDGLSGRAIARALGVGAPRVSRLLRSGVEKLRTTVRRRLGETPAAAGGDPWTALREVAAESLATLEPGRHLPLEETPDDDAGEA